MNCFELIEKLEFSARGELEITDLNNEYLNQIMYLLFNY